ncbi:hypothetical protein GIB67_034313 [Kingdonia uniflora]|uniref:Phytocyanin domain-containing protein n=1 Tax=Kingdonia uniflora TaxID=39325 RepID=A0A7J7NRU5_9MAGN|nr:hypothetical protein GIB67_034313 [Kingdonia uniflora]
MFILVVAILISAGTLAKEFVVGDDSGWTIKFDYQTWATGKEFHVGDKLVFNYPVGAHNVHKVNATGFQDCVAPLDAIPLATGSDVVTLATPGKKWYICGVGKHCEVGGQKLVITVLPKLSASAPAPAPQAVAPTSAANGVVSSVLQMLLAAIVYVVTIMV